MVGRLPGSTLGWVRRYRVVSFTVRNGHEILQIARGQKMELREALKEQYHAGLAMLAECVEKCPPGLWIEGQYPRRYWRIAFHAAFFTHLYLGQKEEAFEPWPARKEGVDHGLWQQPPDVEPYELPEEALVYTRVEILDYIRFVDALIDPTVDRLNLEADETGFHWYPNMSKLSHELMNIRHLQGHVGQLSELLMAAQVDTRWVARSSGLSN
ncbi:MAG: hypothetical protein KGJ62_03985 [Armatimonadetes bacterium]|nr:hypothetical protein [Armatimonadota bacterium]MDE2207830.1 hypothetical protein [Armatimonadota bacterium]